MGHESLPPGQSAITQRRLTVKRKAARSLLPRRQYDSFAGQNFREMIRRQQARRHRGGDQWLRHRPGTELLDERAEFPCSKPGAAGFLGNPKAEPAHLAHLQPCLTMKPGLPEAQRPNALQITCARRDARGALYQHPEMRRRLHHLRLHPGMHRRQ